ncbi:MAG: CHC2 zinc finger domain-containing protein [Clostridiaceae bacterium]|nr:CHC2 zinc finger domain-containing protein [Clostridiaceae bacterium]
MNDYALYAKEISDSVKMKDAFIEYGFEVNRTGYVSCPFHNENTGSLKVYNDHFYCFGCGQSGDVISLVMKLFGLSFIEAVKKINDDFVLNLPLEIENFSLSEQINFANKSRKIKREKEQDEQKRIVNNNNYFKLLDEYIKCEKNIEKYQPTQYVDELNPQFVEACSNIERLGYLLDTFDREGGPES